MFGSLVTGMTGYLRGARWMMRHPMLLILSLLPMLIGLIGFVAVMMFFFQYGNAWVHSKMTAMMMAWFSGWEDHWYWQMAYWLVRGLLLVSMLMLGAVSALVLASAIASPVNEFISIRVESDLTGVRVSDLPWRAVFKVLIGELGKAVIVMIVPILFLFIPGLNLLSGLVAAFLMGWDFYDYPLARRGWGFGRRLAFVVKEFWTVLGFGLWLAIPVVHVFLMPMAIAGGTILNIEALARRGLVGLKVPQP
jgi:uncharacterized protein involved in cysteine biosynthesis